MMRSAPSPDGHRLMPDARFMNEQRLAYILLAIAPALFASNMLTARLVHDLVPPVGLAFWRWAVTFLLLLVGPQLWRQRRDALAEWKDLLLLGAFGMGVCGAFVYIGAQTTPASNIGLIYSASPILIVLIAGLFYGERVTPRQGIGIALSLAGVLAIIARGDPAVLTGLAFTIGDLWIAAAMAGWALYAILLKYRPSRLGLMTRFADAADPRECAGGAVPGLLRLLRRLSGLCEDPERAGRGPHRAADVSGAALYQRAWLSSAGRAGTRLPSAGGGADPARPLSGHCQALRGQATLTG